jgi:hypothetical protein
VRRCTWGGRPSFVRQLSPLAVERVHHVSHRPSSRQPRGVRVTPIPSPRGASVHSVMAGWISSKLKAAETLLHQARQRSLRHSPRRAPSPPESSSSSDSSLLMFQIDQQAAESLGKSPSASDLATLHSADDLLDVPRQGPRGEQGQGARARGGRLGMGVAVDLGEGLAKKGEVVGVTRPLHGIPPREPPASADDLLDVPRRGPYGEQGHGQGAAGWGWGWRWIWEKVLRRKGRWLARRALHGGGVRRGSTAGECLARACIATAGVRVGGGGFAAEVSRRGDAAAVRSVAAGGCGGLESRLGGCGRERWAGNPGWVRAGDGIRGRQERAGAVYR